MMHWSCNFILRVVGSLTLLLAALLYTLFGTTQQTCSTNYSVLCCFKTLLRLVLLSCAVYVLGFFEAGQVGICRINTMSRHELEVTAITANQEPTILHTQPFRIIYDRISKLKGIEKYLVGRQLAVTGLIFFISYLLTFPESFSNQIPPILQFILINTGLPGALITLIFAQIYPQLLADEYTIHILDKVGTLMSVHVAYMLEHLGVLTSFVYLIQILYSYCLCSYNIQQQHRNSCDWGSDFTDNITEDHASISSSPQQEEIINLFPFHSSSSVASLTEARAATAADTTTGNLNDSDADEFISSTAFQDLQQLFQAGYSSLIKIFVSSLIVLAALLLVLTDIVWIKPKKFGHPVVGVILLLLCMTIIFYLEGLQLAILSMPTDIVNHSGAGGRDYEFKRAIIVRKYIQQNERVIVKRFFIGRQIFVVLTTFLASTICSPGDGILLAKFFSLYSINSNGASSFSTNDYNSNVEIEIASSTGMTSSSTCSFLLSVICNPNLATVILLLNLTILPAQLLARKKPVHFLNLRGSMLFLKASLFFESLGVAHFSWYLFYLTKKSRMTYLYHTTNSNDDMHNSRDSDRSGNALVANFNDNFDSSDRLSL